MIVGQKLLECMLEKHGRNENISYKIGNEDITSLINGISGKNNSTRYNLLESAKTITTFTK